MPNLYETVLEIDLKALKHNLEYIKSKLKPSTKILAVVKAFGYGTDDCEIAKCLVELKVDYFAVAYTKEGVALRNAGITAPILILHPQPLNFRLLIENKLEPSLYNLKVLKTFIDVAKNIKQQNYPVHIKFNTGLNRLGFRENDIAIIIENIVATPHIKVASIFSHLAASEDLEKKEFTLQQIQSFKAIATEFKYKIGYSIMLHQLNTSGVFNYPEAQFDMVRLGIGLFGFANITAETKKLRNVASLKSVISQIHHIKKGESIGYNQSFIADRPTQTATIPIGHADGIHRAFGNGNGYVTIKGHKALIIGNVCMDMLMVNITDIDCKEGDEVVIFDDQKTVNVLAKNINTISYEILTAISQRVKRVVK